MHPAILTLSSLTACALLLSCQQKEDTKKEALLSKEHMVMIPAGKTRMGSEGVFETPFGRKEFPEERPIREIEVAGFLIDINEVTNDQFTEFVKSTHYITFAEREAKAEDFPQAALAHLPPFPFRQGSMVFSPPESFEGDPNDPGASLSWWRWDPTANWRHPSGKDSDLTGKGSFPVVCVTYEDATAYLKWAGKRLPTEAEWEFAARGGLKGKIFNWGDEMKVGSRWMANTYHGTFPTQDSAEDGFAGAAPVQSFPPNGYGLYDMAGNAWEICSDFYDPQYPSRCDSCDPKGPETWVNRDTLQKGKGSPSHVIKGGSFLCHISYCMRYRPAARHSVESDSPANHVGFRGVKDLDHSAP